MKPTKLKRLYHCWQLPYLPQHLGSSVEVLYAPPQKPHLSDHSGWQSSFCQPEAPAHLNLASTNQFTFEITPAL